jgi:transcriptional regulator with XRE-family HTH domain
MLHPVGTGQRPAAPPARPEQPRPLLRSLLGDVLRRARRDQRRTLAEVAGRARVSMQYLSELERGRKEASSEVLAAVCDALGMDLAALLAELGRQLAREQARRGGTVIRLRNLADDGAAVAPAPPQALGHGEIMSLLAA